MMATAARSSAQQHHFKIVLLGEGCVGKTSLILRYVEDKFNDKHNSTIQASFLMKKLNLDGQRATLAIWDTAGQERFHALGPIYYRDSHAAILVYDITDKDSFLKVQNWVKELRRILGNKVILAIVGNKIDLEKDRNVSASEALEYTNTVGATHFLTSAKTNRGIEDMFLEITKQLLKEATDREEQRHQGQSPDRPAGVVVVEESPVSKKSCCG